MPAYRLRITGKVQGVWYRASAKDKALELGLRGRVWNEPDGAVGALIQGDELQTAAFVGWCWEGPPLARVEHVDVAPLEDEQAYGSFEITRRPE
jgi:acylphosphatase